MSWVPVIVEGLRKALPWLLERFGKGSSPGETARLKRIEWGVDQLNAKFDVQEGHLAAVWKELGELNRRIDAAGRTAATPAASDEEDPSDD